MKLTHVNSVVAGLLLLAVAACPEPNVSPFEPEHGLLDVLNPSVPTANATPIQCPTPVSRSVSGLIGPLGGALSLDGTVVTFPLGAVLSLEKFTLTIPASGHMEIDVSAAGKGHYIFQKPILISIDYSRCGPVDLTRDPFAIWYWNGTTLLEHMGGIDNRLLRRITFVTPHFSGYVIAD